MDLHKEMVISSVSGAMTNEKYSVCATDWSLKACMYVTFTFLSTRLVFLVSGGPGRSPLSGHSVATGLRNKLRKQKTDFLVFKARRVDTVG